MTNPAIEAVQRAMRTEELRIRAGAEFDGTPHRLIKLGAYAALAPLRELEVPQNLRVVAEMLSKLDMDTPADQKITDDFVMMIRNMADNTARLIYPSEEL
jgi:hypothetical protein